MNINEVKIAGRLTSKPKTQELPSGKTIANFSLAVNRNYTDKNGNKQEETDFLNIKMFGRSADALEEWAIKGQVIYVEGRLNKRSWEKDGEKKYRLDIIANSFQFGEKPRWWYTKEQDASKEKAEEVDEEITPEDIPF